MLNGGNDTRREFLKKSAVAVCVPMILPAAVFGQAAPGNRINIGIIGTGGRGRSHVGSLFELKNSVQITCFCDVNAAQREKMRARLQEMQWCADAREYNDFRDLLQQRDLDAVIVAVPDHWHAHIAATAAGAGKHLYSEKPFAFSIGEGRDLLEAVCAHSVVFQHGTQQRSMPQYRIAVDLVKGGFLGEVHTYKVGSPYGPQGGSKEVAPVPEELDYNLWLGPAPWHEYTEGRCNGDGGVGWYHISDYSGGWVTAWGSHDVDIAQWANDSDRGGPVEVSGTAEFATNGAYDTAWKWHAECLYHDGKRLIYTSEHENPHGVRIEGSEGWVFVNREVIEAGPEPVQKALAEMQKKDTMEPEGHMANFLRCIRQGGIPNAPAEAAHRSTSVCHLCNIAMRTGRTIRWNPRREQILNDPEASAMLRRPMRAPWLLT